MAAKKTGKNLQKTRIPQKAQTSQTIQAKPKSFFKNPLLPVIVIVVVFGTALLQITGILHLPHIGGPIINEIQPPATVGIASAYDFEELISVLNPDYNGDRSAYTFYLGSGVGFPPMGMILGTNGILNGTPTGKDGKFQVCVKDVGGNSMCRNYHLTVNPADETNPDNNVQPGGCTIDARCGQPSNPNQPASINNPIIDGVFVIKSCNCPAGTYMHTALGETKYCACQ